MNGAKKRCEACRKPLTGDDAYRRRFCSVRCFKPVAQGMRVNTKNGAGRRVAVVFDEAQFAEIRARAVKEKTSLSKQVALLCEWGLEA